MANNEYLTKFVLKVRHNNKKLFMLFLLVIFYVEHILKLLSNQNLLYSDTNLTLIYNINFVMTVYETQIDKSKSNFITTEDKVEFTKQNKNMNSIILNLVFN